VIATMVWLLLRFVDGGADDRYADEVGGVTAAAAVQLEDESTWRQVEVRNRAVRGHSCAALASVVASGVRTLLELEEALQVSRDQNRSSD
jgi:acyl transferase domain-containing protein